jgi:hypothetical protein
MNGAMVRGRRAAPRFARRYRTSGATDSWCRWTPGAGAPSRLAVAPLVRSQMEEFYRLTGASERAFKAESRKLPRMSIACSRSTTASTRISCDLPPARGACATRRHQTADRSVRVVLRSTRGAGFYDYADRARGDRRGDGRSANSAWAPPKCGRSWARVGRTRARRAATRVLC